MEISISTPSSDSPELLAIPSPPSEPSDIPAQHGGGSGEADCAAQAPPDLVDAFHRQTNSNTAAATPAPLEAPPATAEDEYASENDSPASIVAESAGAVISAHVADSSTGGVHSAASSSHPEMAIPQGLLPQQPRHSAMTSQRHSRASSANSIASSASLFALSPGPMDASELRANPITANKNATAKTPRPASRFPSSTVPRSATSAAMEKPSSAIVAVFESRTVGGEIGIACVDTGCPELILSQFTVDTAHTKVLAKLQIHDPVEIIMPSTSCESGRISKLYQLIGETFPQSKLVAVQRKYFSETKGLHYIRQHAMKDCKSVEIDVSGKYHSLAAAAALLKYLEFTQDAVYAPASLNVVFRGAEKSMMIDMTSTQHLELLRNARHPHTEHSLYGVLNHCRTAQGARLLRSNILEPPTDKPIIESRLDAVEEITRNDSLFASLQKSLVKFVDIDHLLSMLITVPKQQSLATAEALITKLIQLKHTLECVPELAAALRDCKCSLLRSSHGILSDSRFAEILTTITTVISEDTKLQKGVLSMRAQKCFAVKPNINGLLDVARRAYTETIEDVYNLVGQYAAKYSLPLRTAFNASRGFFITMPLHFGASKLAESLEAGSIVLDGNDSDDDGAAPHQGKRQEEELQFSTGAKRALRAESLGLPKIFQQIIKTKKTLSFTSADVIKYNDRVNESLQEIYLMTNIVISDLLAEVRERIACLYKLSGVVSSLDMLFAFAYHSTASQQYVRPEFTNTLAVKSGRHILLEQVFQSGEMLVANDAFMSDACNFQIITGPNMSGKSTYLCQTALLQIVAQMGCFVPAEYASFRIADHLFTRIGSDDHIESNSSTFMLEMRETSYIIQHATSRSLIIMDELGRGTSSQEGVGIAHAVCEHLLSLKAFTLFATHFAELTLLDSLYPNVSSFYLEVLSLQDQRKTVLGSMQPFHRPGGKMRPVFTHVLKKGVIADTHYGIASAELAGFPSTVVERARAILQLMQTRKTPSLQDQPHFQRERAVFQLASKLVQVARDSQLSKEQLREYLQDLARQNAFLAEKGMEK